jgi:hypothetical protein
VIAVLAVIEETMRNLLKSVLIPAGLVLLLAFTVQAAPPIGERLAAVLDAPLTADPLRNNAGVGTTPIAAIATENSKKTDATVQLFVVTNTHASQNICFGTVSAVGATCNDALCDTTASWTAGGYAAKMNCTAGNASQGSVVPAGQSRAFRYDGTRCACVVADGAATTGQIERVVR